MQSRGPQQSLDEWFWRLSECDDAEQQRLLEGLRRKNAELADELEKMLAATGELSSFMRVPDDPQRSPIFGNATPGSWSRPAEDETQQAAAAAATEMGITGRVPKQIGPYKLLEPIGEGGMGVVYLAAQQLPVRRKVAIKIIKPGMDSRQVIARFEAERQALAMMEHPNIAKVFDAGTTESGLPFFVMELVRGIPITEYCDRARMHMRRRLELFQSTCSALQHAHNKGIIHRDIKPSNVLVTEHDGTPVVKVIDFGVAKALDQDLTDKTLYTGVFQMIGTPLYMSPEQASLSDLDVDTRSDVYSLGVLLYELVAGTLPLDRSSAKTMSLEEIRRHICDAEPQPPSRRLSSLRQASETIAQCRGVSTAQLQKLVNGELDWIVMRAIEKDRRWRFQSPRELSEDIERYLLGEAVQACPPSWIYRTGKFGKKHRSILLVSATILLTLTVATVVSINQAIKATRASTTAARNLEFAEDQTRRMTEYLYADDMVAATRHYFSGNHSSVERILSRHQAPEREYLRGFEWHLLQGLSPVQTEELCQVNDRLNDFVLSPDGQSIFMGDSADRIICVDRSGGRRVEVTTGLEWIYDLECSSDGRVIAVGDNGLLHIYRWSAAQGELMREKELHVCETSLDSLAVDGTSETAWAGGGDGWIYQIDLRKGESRALLELPRNRAVRDLEVSNDTLLASNSDALLGILVGRSQDREITTAAWRIAPNRNMLEIRDIELSRDGRWIAFAQLMGLVSFVRNGPDPAVEFSQLMSSDIHSLAISSDGQWLAAGDSAGHIHLVPTQIESSKGFLDSANSRTRRVRSWQVHKGKIEQLEFVHSELDNSLQLFSAGRDGRIVISHPFDQSPTSYHSADEFEPQLATASANCHLLWSHLALDVPVPEGSEGLKREGIEIEESIRFASGGHGSELFTLIDSQQLVRFNGRRLTNPSLLWQAPESVSASRFAVSPDGKRFAICVLLQVPNSHQIEIYQVGHNEPVWSIDSNLANSMCFSPDGELLAYVWNNDIVLLDVLTGEKLHILKGHADSVQGLAFSPDGTQLASVSSDRQLKVWSVNSGRLSWSQQAHQNRALAVAFHPVLPTIATVGADAIVRFWSSRERVAEDSVRLVGEFPLEVGRCAGLEFSSDGKSLFIHHAERGVTELRASFE